jgi:hypothetical protein
MRKLIFTFFLCLLAAVQSAWGYKFSYTYKGQTLYYYVLSTTNKTAAVTSKFPGNPYLFGDVIGAVEIPATVTDGGVTYSVTSIGEWAFCGCSGLTSVTIPTSVTSIGSSVFYGCSDLTSVTIPASVTSIGGQAFDRCSGLTDINVSASNAKYQSIDGILYNKAGDTLICCPGGRKGSLTIPASVTSIGESWAFSWLQRTDECDDTELCQILSGRGAFSGCSGLTSVTVKAETPPTCRVITPLFSHRL